MKLYYSPGACSLSPHIVLLESGLPFESERVDLKQKVTASGANYTSINPKGYVPALRLDGGRVLTEGAVIVQWIADQRPESGLAPPLGSFERLRLHDILLWRRATGRRYVPPTAAPSSPTDTFSR